MGKMLNDYFPSSNENRMEGKKLREKSVKWLPTNIKKKAHKGNGVTSAIREFK